MAAMHQALELEQPTRATTYYLGKRLADSIRKLMQFDSYRPELHYMRGPGPKWRAKHDYVFAAIDNARQRFDATSHASPLSANSGLTVEAR